MVVVLVVIVVLVVVEVVVVIVIVIVIVIVVIVADRDCTQAVDALAPLSRRSRTISMSFLKTAVIKGVTPN